MALALWLALPGASLVERLSQSSRSDLLTVAYLRAWLAADRVLVIPAAAEGHEAGSAVVVAPLWWMP